MNRSMSISRYNSQSYYLVSPGGGASEVVRKGDLKKVPDDICSEIFAALFESSIPVTQRHVKIHHFEN